MKVKMRIIFCVPSLYQLEFILAHSTPCVYTFSFYNISNPLTDFDKCEYLKCLSSCPSLTYLYFILYVSLLFILMLCGVFFTYFDLFLKYSILFLFPQVITLNNMMILMIMCFHGIFYSKDKSSSTKTFLEILSFLYRLE